MQSKRGAAFWTLLAVVVLVSVPSFAQIAFQDFSSTTGLALNGTAAQATNTYGSQPWQVLRLAPDTAQHKAGSAWFTTQQSIANGFTAKFQFQVTHNPVNGTGPADGLAFVIQNSQNATTGGALALGSTDGAIGYGQTQLFGTNFFAPAIDNSIAIEIDTHQNSYDPDGNHIAVQSCGRDLNIQSHTATCPSGSPAKLGLVSNPGGFNLSDGSLYTVVVDYDPGRMRIYLGKSSGPGIAPTALALVLTVSVDLSTLLNLQAGPNSTQTAFVGFTGATGDSVENSDILNWSFTSGTASTTITQTLVPNSPNPTDTNYVFGSYNHKLEYTFAAASDVISVTATPVDQGTFHTSRLVNTPFSGADCAIYAGTGGKCVLFTVVCSSSATDCTTLTYTLFNNFNSDQTITRPCVLQTDPIGSNNWKNVIVTFSQTALDPGSKSVPTGTSDFFVGQNCTALPTVAITSPANNAYYQLGVPIPVQFSCATDPTAPLVTVTQCQVTINGTTYTDGSGASTFTPSAIGPMTAAGSVADSILDTGSASSTFNVGTAPAFGGTTGNSTFTVGVPGTFTITTTGSPTPTLTESGPLAGGVGFADNGNGSGTVSGTPGAGTGGTYPFSIAAFNGVGGGASQSFMLTVNQPPAITSANNTTFTVGTAGSFNVTATGFPAPTLTETGALPSGVTFVGGVLGGTPSAGTGGVYTITFVAHNGVVANAMQTFTLTVIQSPVITSANHATFTVGAASTFHVTATGFPAPTVSETGALPAGVTFAGGILSGTPAAGTGGIYNLTFTAHNGIAADATQAFTLTVNQVPIFTSASSASMAANTPGSFQVTTKGFPAPGITETGALPAGLTFTNNGDGTATFAGTPTAPGVYSLALKASNAAGSAQQTLTITIVGPQALFSTYSVNFGTLHLGSSAKRAITITNTGTSPLVFTAKSITVQPGSNAELDDFVFYNTCPTSLPAKASCVINLVYFADDLGTAAAVLSISDNAPTSPQLVSLGATMVK